MNTMIVKTLTSRPARRVYRQIGKHGAKIAAGIVVDVTTYFAGQKIIKTIKNKTNFESEEVLIIKARIVEA